MRGHVRLVRVLRDRGGGDLGGGDAVGTLAVRVRPAGPARRSRRGWRSSSCLASGVGLLPVVFALAERPSALTRGDQAVAARESRSRRSAVAAVGAVARRRGSRRARIGLAALARSPQALVRRGPPDRPRRALSPAGRGPGARPLPRPCSVPAPAVHVELFAANRVVLVAAGIGTRGPRRRSGGRIVAARCYGALVTLEPTGVILVRPGARLTVGDLFRSWGQPLTSRRLAGFRLAVAGHRLRRRPPPRRTGRRGSPLARHAEIVLEVGPHVPAASRLPLPAGRVDLRRVRRPTGSNPPTSRRRRSGQLRPGRSSGRRADPPAVAQLLGAAGQRRLDAVAAAGLGGVQRAVGLADQLLGLDGVLGQGGRRRCWRSAADVSGISASLDRRAGSSRPPRARRCGRCRAAAR